MPVPGLNDDQRKAIHEFALNARELMIEETAELLEGRFGLHTDGTLEPLDNLPHLTDNPEAQETYRRLERYIQVAREEGEKSTDAVTRLIKETAFTWVNRLSAFKMMEARGLIRQTVSRGSDSNAFKFYLADPKHEADYERYNQGDVQTAYRNFLLWQCANVAEEIRVLFDPENLPSRLFPRPSALRDMLTLLNSDALAGVWNAEETVGWIYQYFNEPELQAAYSSSGKFQKEDIASVTQLFTSHWIVRYLVHNTLGRLWLSMHPDSRLRDHLDYLVPLAEKPDDVAVKPAQEITLLDPACGTMHFGLVAFDLFVEMYREEIACAGQPGWPVEPSVEDEAAIPAAIVANNLYGIDIDLRAAQLAALALYLKAKTHNKDARITDSNLAVAGVRPLDGERLNAFLETFGEQRPIFERILKALWQRLEDAEQLGSLLRLERDISDMVEAERAKFKQAPLFAGLPGEFEADAAEEEFWGILEGQVVQALDFFVRDSDDQTLDQAFFVGEAEKGLRLLRVMLEQYDVVVTNPPYMSRRNMNKELKDLVNNEYPAGKGDLYAAFIQRCLEFAGEVGRVGMLTMQSFMFISSYEELRKVLTNQAVIETMAHTGPALFETGNPGTLQTTAFVLRREPDTPKRESHEGVYFRLVHEPDAESKRRSFEAAVAALQEQEVIA